MNKMVIVAIHSQYIHSSPAPWLLAEGCADIIPESVVKEYTVNDTPENIVASICDEEPDIVAFSVYIWNVRMVSEIAGDLKKINNGMVLAAGGPEVGFGYSDDIKNLFDYIVPGEGVCEFQALLNKLTGVSKEIKTYEKIYINAVRAMVNNAGGRILYLETSRGCPFSCAYCLAANSKKVRCVSMEQVKEAIDIICSSDTKTVKLTDRTFNANIDRACEIIRYIKRKNCKNWHFEVAADIMTKQIKSLLKTLPPGLVQLEIGIQSINQEVLDRVSRKTHIEKVLENTAELISYGNMMIHVDLIAGLPGETLESFICGFNTVHQLMPHQLQLGMLKKLKGTPLEQMCEEYQAVFSDNPPYRVLKTRDITSRELNELRYIEFLTDKCLNSGRFILTVNALAEGEYDGNYYRMYLELYTHINKKSNGVYLLSAAETGERLADFVSGFAGKNEYFRLISIDIFCSGVHIKQPEHIRKVSEANCKIDLHDAYRDIVEAARKEGILSPDADKKYIRRNLLLGKLPDGTVCVVNTEVKSGVTSRYPYFIYGSP